MGPLKQELNEKLLDLTGIVFPLSECQTKDFLFLFLLELMLSPNVLGGSSSSRNLYTDGGQQTQPKQSSAMALT